MVHGRPQRGTSVSETEGRVYIDLPDKCFSVRETREGEEFNVVRIPRGVRVSGAVDLEGCPIDGAADVSGYTFSPLYFGPSVLGEDLRCVPLLADREVWLTHRSRKADGTWSRDETIKVMPSDLAEGVSSWLERRKDREAAEGASSDRVLVSLPKAWCHSYTSHGGKLFNKVYVPSGTRLRGARTLDDLPIDGEVHLTDRYFNPLFVDQHKTRESWATIPLIADREIWLKRDLKDEAGAPVTDQSGKRVKDIIKCDPRALRSAILAHFAERALESRAGEAQAAEARQDEPVVTYSDPKSRSVMTPEEIEAYNAAMREGEGRLTTIFHGAEQGRRDPTRGPSRRR